MTTSHDRREFLRRAGLGAAAATAWVAPQVLGTATASAGCTAITKELQINPSNCASVTPTGVDPYLPGCVPSGWIGGQSDVLSITCTQNVNGGIYGLSVRIDSVGCTIVAGKAVKYCPSGSSHYVCVDGTVTGGNTVTFATISPSDPAGCISEWVGITVRCCT